MFKKNWKTTLSGLATIAGGILMIVKGSVNEGLATIVAGIGLVAAKDAESTIKETETTVKNNNTPIPLSDFVIAAGKKVTDNMIYTFLSSYPFSKELKKLIICQARYETNNYTSNVFLKNNNLFGYKYVGQKKWAQSPGIKAGSKDPKGNPDGGTYANYAKITDSVGELCDYLLRKEKLNTAMVALSDIKTSYAYASFLKAHKYFGETEIEYANGLEKYKPTVDAVFS